MKEKKYGIIGKPLSHSLSPFLHNYWFNKYKILANYSLIEVELKEIDGVIKKIRSGELDGINVTVPYKQAVIPFLDLIIDDAEKTQSVNTINLNEIGQVVGNNTDVHGLVHGFINKLNNQNLDKNKILILGAGGVTPSIVYALLKKGIKKIFISNRTLKKAENIKKRFPLIKIIDWKNIEIEIEYMDIVINATSLGLKGENNFQQEFNNIKPNLVYYDVIYNPNETTMIKKFNKRGVKTFNGLEMFICQGQKSFCLWNEINPNPDEILKETLVKKLR
jgi:shikimate dehydrogenase